MKKINNYAEVLLKKGLNLNKKNSLFISISSDDYELAEALILEASNIGIKDIFINYYDLEANIKFWEEHVYKDSKFLFITSDKWYDSISYQIYNDFFKKEFDVIYTVATNLEKVLKDSNMSVLSSDDYIKEFSTLISNQDKVATSIKNFKLNTLYLTSLKDTKLTIKFENQVNKIVDSKRIVRIPNYTIELIPKENTVNGYVEATKSVFYGKEKIDGLKLILKDDYIIDFDCDNNFELAKKILKNYKEYRLSTIGLTGIACPLYNSIDTYEDYVLDKTSGPYLMFTSKNFDNLYVPINSKNLTITGANENKQIVLYENEDFSKKVKRI